MRQAILLYNPVSGRRRNLAQVEAAASILRRAGINATSAPTRAAGAASEQVREAIASGCDAVFACGGDGTIHDVLQGLVGTQVPLGIIPLGTANALAHDLGLPLSPKAAAQFALSAKPRRIAVGTVQYRDLDGNPGKRYFTVTVGVGVDGHLFYKLNATAKRWLGMAAYCLRATQLWLTHPMDKFATSVPDKPDFDVSQLLAVRIRYFGGVLRELAPGASLERGDLRLVLFHTCSRTLYLGYVLRGLFGARWKVPGIELTYGSTVACRDLPQSRARIFVEADGELLGTLPVEIGMVPDALSILAPPPTAFESKSESRTSNC